MESLEVEKQGETKDEKTFGKLVTKFMGYTSAHGIGRLVDSKTIFWKVFWSAVCLGAFGMFIYQVHGLFMLYLSRPVSSSVKVTFNKRLPFPAVTICNLNMIRENAMPPSIKKALQDKLRYGLVTEELSEYDEESDIEDEQRRRRSHRSESQPSAHPEDDHNDYATDLALDDGEDDGEDVDTEDEYPNANDLSPQTRIRLGISWLIGGMDPNDLYDKGHQFSDMIVNCTWRGVDCKTGNLTKYWTLSWNYKYGNCYTFNDGYDADYKPLRTLKTTKPGPSQGLILHINVEQSLYIGALTMEAGIRVVLHDQGQMPFPYERGFSVSPGMATSVGVKKKLIKRLDRFRNGSCLPGNELPKNNIYRKIRNTTRYSEQVCLNSCLGRSQLSRCSCSEDFYLSEGKPCDILNPRVANCLKIVKREFNHDRLECLDSCRQPCREEVIQKTISSSQWPSRAYQTYLASQSMEFSKNESDNHMLLNIFFNELNYETIEEEYSYGTINLLADIGGQLGLWIGISVITCCEVLELFMKFFSHVIKKCKRGHNSDKY